MLSTSNRKTGHRKRRSREAKRLVRDRRIFAKLRVLAAEGERRHEQFDEPIEPLTVYYGKQDRPSSWDLSPFPMGIQDNGKPMPQWEDLSQWMKVNMGTIVCFEWDLLTFNINLHPDLEARLVARGNVRLELMERVRSHVRRCLGANREYFFVIEGHQKGTGAQTHLHMHGAIASHSKEEQEALKVALGKAAGQGLRKAKRVPRSVHSRWFKVIQAAYGNYLFKFTRRDDPRLDDRRLVMSRPMTQAAAMFWSDISGQS